MEETKLNANLKFKDIENDTDLCSFKELYELANQKDVYSISEIKTNKVWKDNKPIYRCVISLPNNYTNSGARTITHNLGVDNYTNIIHGSLNYAGMTFPIPRIAVDNNNAGISLLTTNSIVLDVATAISSYKNLELTFEYTKKN